MKASPTLKVLKRARRIISRPNAWTKGCLARSGKDGQCVDASDPDAASFCALGAIERASLELRRERPSFGLNSLSLAHDRLRDAIPSSWKREAVGLKSVSPFNDAPSTTHKDVLKMYDKAIKAEERR